MSLTELIREAAEHHTDPRDIAAEVARHTPDQEVRDYYASALIGTVRRELSKYRNIAMDNVFDPKPETKKVRSAKLEQRRDWWADMCKSKLHVAGTWKLLGDCGLEDLTAAIMERREDSEQSLARASQYESLRGLLRSHKVRTVDRLPRSAVSGLFGGSKAA